MIKIPRWDPFREVARIERDMRNMFDDFWGGRVRKEALPGPGKAQLPVRREEALVGTPTVDIVDKKDKLVLRSEMPGAKLEQRKRASESQSRKTEYTFPEMSNGKKKRKRRITTSFRSLFPKLKRPKQR